MKVPLGSFFIKNKEMVQRKIRVMAFGTFDLVHKGHLSFFRQAKKYGDYLIVSVSRDLIVERLKGRKPLFSERKRMDKIRKLRVADKVVLGRQNNYFLAIKKLKPDVICLGYDQRFFVDELREFIRKNKLKIKIIRLKGYKTNIYKSSILKRLSGPVV